MEKHKNRAKVATTRPSGGGGTTTTRKKKGLHRYVRWQAIALQASKTMGPGGGQAIFVRLSMLQRRKKQQIRVQRKVSKKQFWSCLVFFFFFHSYFANFPPKKSATWDLLTTCPSLISN